MMKLSGLKLHDSDAEDIIKEVLSGKKYTSESLAFAKIGFEAVERRKKRRKFL
ncbi:hypothetical protein [Priestia megaterium]|uniref:hypothetical protein n=1 Tax=Priestia megaterium TaxID=1404 RepID=UPI001642B4B5|nr:hypothetical protein [Priestia megaterium]